MNLEVYTDGAYSSIRDQGGIGIVFILDGKIIKKFSKSFKHTTNNRMEIIAVIIALQSIKAKCDSITIYSDSQYVIGCATNKFGRKKNLDLWKLYTKVVSRLNFDINFVWVKGHADNQYNQIADSLANSASQEIEL